jgi:oligopeptide/dipeptide ABC transporter ATP-binding protein
VWAGEAVGLVGESGSGKTLTALALVGLLPPAMQLTGGTALFRGRDLLRLGGEEMRAVRGAGIGFVFQEPASALSPVFTIGDQVAEALVVHGRASWPEARRRAVALLDAVRIPDAARRARDYPHHLSGGLRQRAMLAVALACDPSLLVADEPTTALDPTVQAEVLDLLDTLRDTRRLGVLLVSHDLAVVASRTHRVAVMYAGRIVEQAPVGELFASPRHPYTRALLAAAPGSAPLKRRLPTIDGTVPPLTEMPPGCAFEPRCAARVDACRLAPPAIVRVGIDHDVACVLAREGVAGAAS